MPIPVLNPRELNVSDLEKHLHRTIKASDQDSAQAAITYAMAFVIDVVGFDVFGTEVYNVSEFDADLARGVALRIAAQWFTNPEDRATYSGPESLSWTASQQMLSRIMSEADRRHLVGIQLRYAPGIG